jgi:sugar-specific transcriptional regulator TrmB
MNPEEVLLNYGLEEKEAAVYLALLELGETTVLTVAKKAGIKRPTCYLVLQSLIAKGLVSRVVKGRKIFFAPQHPQKLVSETELRLQEIQSAVPQLEALMQTANKRPRVIIFEGKSALDKAYDEYFVVKGEILFLSNMELVHDIFVRTLQKLDYVASSPDYSAREIGDDSQTTRAYAQRVAASHPFRQVRVMPKQFSPFATDIGIFGNITLITSATKEYFTVKIESEEIANAFRAMFEAMWMISKEPSAS